MIRRRVLRGSENKYVSEYLTIESLADSNVITFKYAQNLNNCTISFSTDKVNWESATSTYAGVTLATLSNGQKLYLKKKTSNAYYKNYITSTGDFNLSGNAMSLLYGDNFQDLVTLPAKLSFAFLFDNCTTLKSIKNLVLPATTLTESCYLGMFEGCTGLTSIPEGLLPATTLAVLCYASMFENCTNLKNVPSNLLPATTLKASCYVSMFKGCTSLTTAPDLPAETLITRCYYSMFFNCSSLTYIKAMFTTAPSTSYTLNWVSGVADYGKFVKNSAATWTNTYGVSAIPKSSSDKWTVTTASS